MSFELPRSPRDIQFESERLLGAAAGAREVSFRTRLESYDDEVATVALDRDLLGPLAPRMLHKASPPPRRDAPPVFNFRAAAVLAEPALIITSRPPPPRTSAAGMWLVGSVLLAILAGMAGYKYAPSVTDALKDATHTLDH